jgi:hypothetical protein
MCEYAIQSYIYRECREYHVIKVKERSDWYPGLRGEQGNLIPDPCPERKEVGFCSNVRMSDAIFASVSGWKSSVPCPECQQLSVFGVSR